MWWILFLIAIFLFVVVVIWRFTHAKYDGKIIITQEDGKTLYTLEVDCDIDDIVNRNVLVFKVDKEKIAD